MCVSSSVAPFLLVPQPSPKSFRDGAVVRAPILRVSPTSAGAAVGERIAQLIREHSEVTRCLKDSDTPVNQKLAVVGVALLRSLALEFMRNRSQRPLLCSDSADGTPAKTKQQVVARVTDELRVHRSGGRGQELCVQNLFLMSYDSKGQPEAKYFTQPPVPMESGKTSWHFFSAAVAFRPSLRVLGHTGLAIQHVSYDRALHDTTFRKLRHHQDAALDRQFVSSRA